MTPREIPVIDCNECRSYYEGDEIDEMGVCPECGTNNVSSFHYKPEKRGGRR
jgi:Zn finger protein HypA/HybF involved in hydrogenase expression